MDFRPDYKKESTLKSWLSAQTLVLTATDTKKIRNDAFKVSDDTEVVATVTDR